MFQVPVQVPAGFQYLGTPVDDFGVRRVPVGLLFGVYYSSSVQPVSNVVYVYVK